MAEHPLVVGYDGRTESEIALDHALSEARVRDVPVVVLVVAGLPIDVMNPLDPEPFGFGALPSMTPDGPIEIQPIIAAARTKLEASGVEGSVEWSIGDPASEILRVADAHEATAIVVGTHHHSALGRLLGADVANAVVRHTQREVVVAR